MKKLLAVLLTLALCIGLVPAMAEGMAKEDIKLGVILLHDEDSTYDLNFINGVKDAVQLLIGCGSALQFQREGNVCADCKLLQHIVFLEDEADVGIAVAVKPLLSKILG